MSIFNGDAHATSDQETTCTKKNQKLEQICQTMANVYDNQLQIVLRRRTRQAIGNHTSDIDVWRKIGVKSFKALHDFIVMLNESLNTCVLIKLY